MTGSRRLGVLGGTFDPIHFGHLDAAEAARASLELDEVLFIPAHDPPHKPARPARQRVPSLRARRAGHPGVARVPRLRHGAGARGRVLHRRHAARAARVRLGAVADCSSSSAPTRLRTLRRGGSSRRCSTWRTSPSSRARARRSTTRVARTPALRAAGAPGREPRTESRRRDGNLPRRGADARRVVHVDSRAPRRAEVDRRSRAGGGRAAHHRASSVRSGRRLAWQKPRQQRKKSRRRLGLPESPRSRRRWRRPCAPRSTRRRTTSSCSTCARRVGSPTTS